MSGPSTTPPGWYDDGSGTGTLRFWDGEVWTERTTSAAMPYGPAAMTPHGVVTTDTLNPAPHVVGIVALTGAAVGFVFACLPGALGFGWVLMVIASVLSIIALFLKGAKWSAITGLIVSIVGPIIALFISFAVASRRSARRSATSTTRSPSHPSSLKIPGMAAASPRSPRRQPATSRSGRRRSTRTMSS